MVARGRWPQCHVVATVARGEQLQVWAQGLGTGGGDRRAGLWERRTWRQLSRGTVAAGEQQSQGWVKG